FYVRSVKASMSLGRRAIGVERETERCEQTVSEVQDLVSQNG
ncbi:DNA methylase, partial [Escherichia coli]